MVEFLGEPLSVARLVFLFLALLIACGFEFVNGFHDTANAVATVIYTKSLKPWPAVIWSGLCNFLGCLLGGTAVAFSIVYLLPVDLLVAIGSRAGLAMVLALLLAAILWNFGTWYLGLPASSSHTLIGSIIGVGLANSFLPGHVPMSGVNWEKAREVGLSLLISPLAGFAVAGGLLLLSRVLLKRHGYLHIAPKSDAPPPAWVRAILVLTCTGVSLAHGSNDGQKGVGLVMLILIGILPVNHALNLGLHGEKLNDTVAVVRKMEDFLAREAASPAVATTLKDVEDVRNDLAVVRGDMEGKSSLADIQGMERWRVRTSVLHANAELGKLEKSEALAREDQELVKKARKSLRGVTDYSPTWVLMLVALSLGIGTTIGWKRIVVTVGEKIGKSHLTYGQGACAELVAMTTIGLGDVMGMPTSTTHVLSSAVAGTMAAGKSGVQMSSIKKILLAWILTLPVTIFLSATLFALFRWMFV